MLAFLSGSLRYHMLPGKEQKSKKRCFVRCLRLVGFSLLGSVFWRTPLACKVAELYLWSWKLCSGFPRTHCRDTGWMIGSAGQSSISENEEGVYINKAQCKIMSEGWERFLNCKNNLSPEFPLSPTTTKYTRGKGEHKTKHKLDGNCFLWLW